MISGRAFSVARSINRVSFLAHDRAHRTAQELEIHDAKPCPMIADLADSGDDGVLKASGAHVLLELGLVGGGTGEVEHIHARHVRIHLLERAGLDHRVDALAGADGEMMLAVAADLQVLIQLLVEHHRGALRALGPQAFGNVTLPGLAARDLGLLHKTRLLVGWGWRDCWFRRFQTEGLLGECGRGHC